MSKIAICIMCVEPEKIHVDFLNSISDYSLFMLCDNNACDTNLLNDTNINVIKISDEECFKQGYKNSNCCIKKNPSSWDKIFYYFYKINNNYDYVWILEDDVFVPNKSAFEFLDKKYGDSDLLCKANEISIDGDNSVFHLLSEAKNKHDLPWYCSMVCCCRISKKLFEQIGKYVEEKGELFFIEIMINTIANHNNLSVKKLEELTNIYPKPKQGQRYRIFKNGQKKWIQSSIDDVKKNFMYHPIKDIRLHSKYRILE